LILLFKTVLNTVLKYYKPHKALAVYLKRLWNKKRL